MNLNKKELDIINSSQKYVKDTYKHAFKSVLMIFISFYFIVESVRVNSESVIDMSLYCLAGSFIYLLGSMFLMFLAKENAIFKLKESFGDKRDNYLIKWDSDSLVIKNINK